MFVLKKTYDAKVAKDARFIEAPQSSHDHWLDEANGWEAKFKKAVTDLEKQVRENERLTRDYATRGQLLTDARAERETAEAETRRLRPLAKKYEDKLERDRNRVRPSRSRDRKAAKKEGV